MDKPIVDERSGQKRGGGRRSSRALCRTRQSASSNAPVRKPQRRRIHVSGYQREGRDFCATPSWVTEALLQHVSLWGPVWEPCCDDGAMATVLAAHGHEVVSSDIADCGLGTPGT